MQFDVDDYYLFSEGLYLRYVRLRNFSAISVKQLNVMVKFKGTLREIEYFSNALEIFWKTQIDVNFFSRAHSWSNNRNNYAQNQVTTCYKLPSEIYKVRTLFKCF